MTLGERIKKVRRSLDLTQQAFGQRIGIKQNSIALIESGRNTSDQTIFAICREFNVDETWLRTGEGEMFVRQTRDEEIAAAVERLLSGQKDSLRSRLIIALSRLDESQWSYIENFILGLVDAHSAPTIPDTAAAAIATMQDYASMVAGEKEAEEKSSTSAG